jgi:3-isopropylmalate/(R)-2-methylmalate dehydratase small subunit
VLVAGDNFGCGSSREHAVWALLGAGFRAVVSTSFADIFRGNALGNGLLPIQVGAGVISTLNQACAADGSRPEVSVDLERETITLPNGQAVGFKVPAFARYCLLHGVDEMDVLLEAGDDVARYEETSATFVSTHPTEVIA